MRSMSGCCAVDEPTPDDFVGAVIRTHERIRSNLNALRRGGALVQVSESPADARTISVYCLSHGVETAPQRERRQAEHRWLAV